MVMTEWEVRKLASQALGSPTLLTVRRGLRRPTAVTTLSVVSSQLEGASISSRATSRRSKSIISTPEEQRLFQKLSSSLAVVTSPAKNRLDRFQQKKAMALAEPRKLIHPSKQRSFQDKYLREAAAQERYFSLGGSLAIKRPGKVTPTVYAKDDPIPTQSPQDLASEAATSFSDESAFVSNLSLSDSDESAFVRFPNDKNGECTEAAVVPKKPIAETALINRNCREELDDDDGSSVDLSIVDDSTPYTVEYYDESTFTDERPIGQESTTCRQESTTVAQESTSGVDSILVFSETFETNESEAYGTAEQETSTGGQSTLLSSGRSSIGEAVDDRSTPTSTWDRDTIRSSDDKQDEYVSISTLGPTTIENSLSTSRVTVQSAETETEGHIRPKSIEAFYGAEVIRARQPQMTDRKDSINEEIQNKNNHIARSGSDLSEITTLSVSQQDIRPIPVMNYSNLFSVGGSTIWSNNRNLKQDDAIFLSRAYTLLEFFEMRLNADESELTLVPEDAKELDKKFNVSNRLRFIDSLRMRCLVKNTNTEEVVQRCCRLGLHLEGAHNPIFATFSLANKIMTVPLASLNPKQKKMDDVFGDAHSVDEMKRTETASLTISQLSLHSSDWEPVLRERLKSRAQKTLEAGCPVNLCGVSFLVCVNGDND